jgi:cholesterol oxidase
MSAGVETALPGGRLSCPIEALAPHYDVVVVGSGYGGAVAAARMAEHGRSVCVLERGRELRPGDYPDTLWKLLREVQVGGRTRPWWSSTALYDFRPNPGMTVLVGCGLGGTSLINANVAIEPEDDAFTSGWPPQITREALAPYYARARRGLGVSALDGGVAAFAKAGAMERVRTRLELKSVETALAVTFPGAGAPVDRHVAAPIACTGCGDCVSGCNYGAKNTLIMNYLPRARARGAHILTEARVGSIAPLRAAGPAAPRWAVHFELVGAGRAAFGVPPLVVTAREVFLAAGTLGSTEILFRSRDEQTFPLSDALGTKFSGNGDMLAFAHEIDQPANAVGLGWRSGHGALAPGPCILTSARSPGAPATTRSPGVPRFLLQEGVIPGALAPLLPLAFALGALRGDGSPPPAARAGGGRTPPTRRRRMALRRFRNLLSWDARTTQTFLAMFCDRAQGTLVPSHRGVRVEWPADRNAEEEAVRAALREAAWDLGGRYMDGPFGRITVHPLGGCPMGTSADEGVVNHYGAVFDPSGTPRDDGEPPRHEGLYVCDAAVIPTALGANPLLTITALAERTCDAVLGEKIHGA